MAETETSASAANAAGGVAPVSGSAEGIQGKPNAGLPPRRVPIQHKKAMFSPMLIVFVLLAMILVGGLLFLSQRVVGDTPEKILNAGPQLQAEFIEPHNNYAIRPPVGWRIKDPHDRKNIYITGPNAADFPPLIVVNLEVKAGGIASYLQEHKGRIQFENKTVQFISEEPDSIDGCTNTVRLVYDMDHDPGKRNENNELVDAGKTVRVRTVQFIMESKPRFYSVTCHARADQFDRMLPYFEATARSFRRTKMHKLLPVPINE